MTTVTELMQANLFDVFDERDDTRREAAIDRIYSPGIVFADPESVVTGRRALGEKARGLLESSPGFVFAADGPVLVSHDLGHLAWAFGPAGQDPVVRGIDIALVEDARITRLWTFLSAG